MKKRIVSIAMLMTGILVNTSVMAEQMSIEQAFMRCKQNFSAENQSAARYACFDAIAAPSNVVQEAYVENKSQEVKSAGINITDNPDASLTFLERKWRLSSSRKWHFSELETHHQNYIVTSITSDVNNVASSPSQASTDNRNLENKDVQFQISLKTQVWHDLPVIRNLPWVTSSRLWLAYTQKSYWQIYNEEESRPFRESNFAPEVILSLGLDDKLNRFWPRMVNLGAIHESNGRSNPISRSWNRIYLESAWQIKDQYTLILRPWYRIPDGASDDNPDISRYLGYGDLTLRWDDFEKRKAVSLLVRNNLRSDNKGYAKLSMYYAPFDAQNLKLYMSLSSGYGETLVDYNYNQTIFGIGFAVGE